MPCLTTAFRIGWGLSTWLLYVAVKFELLMVLRWYCVNTLESYNFIDVYIIWATLEALFHYFLYDWPRRIRRPLLVPAGWEDGWGGATRSIYCPKSGFVFQLSFFGSLKGLFKPQSFECIQVRSNHFWINRNSGLTFRLFPSCYISEFLCLLSYFSDNLDWLAFAKIALLELLCLAFLLGI